MHVHTRLALIAVLLTVVALITISIAVGSPLEPRFTAALGGGGACVLGIAATVGALSRGPASWARSAIGGCVAGLGGCAVSLAPALPEYQLKLQLIGVCIAAAGGLLAALGRGPRASTSH